ncbi:MAG: mercury resistance system periplasmic binding protein MerP [Burkholderiaceae bacterium]|nr:mercury resistance system periplasmic binding protein MerP [Burkholderiaceae bacterium]
MKKLFVSLLLAAAAAPLAAAERTATLAVDNMTCAACPITVKKAMSKVNGVTKVEVSYEKREAVVSFDEAKASLQAIAKASADAGYPAREKK